MKPYSLPAKERLKSPLEVSAVYTNGHKTFLFPIMAFYKATPIDETSTSSLRIAFSAPKRKFKKAVDRNTIKRQMREAYRTQKPTLLDSLSKVHLQIDIVFVYASTKEVDFAKMKICIAKIITEIASKKTTI